MFCLQQPVNGCCFCFKLFLINTLSIIYALKPEQCIMSLNLIYRSKTREKTSREKETNSRRRLTDSVKLLHDYAILSGSTGAKFYYANISKLINACAGITNKEDITHYQFSLKETFELAVIGEISKGIYKRKHYKDIYKDIKAKLIALKEYI